nr:MAG TPA: hypothetical protein [Caudoviricetes sp.]
MGNNCENCIASNMCEDVVGSCNKTINYAKVIYNRALDELTSELDKRFKGMEFSSGFPTEDATWANARRQLKDVSEQLKRGVKK